MNKPTTKLERVLEATHEVYKQELARREADYTRELNAKLGQINAQARTIRDERQRHESEIEKLEQRLCEAKNFHERQNSFDSAR